MSLIYQKESCIPARSTAAQIAFRYCSVDNATGVTRETAKRLRYLGIEVDDALEISEQTEI